MQIYTIRVTNDALGLYPVDAYYKNPKYDTMQKGDKSKYFDSPFSYELKDGKGNVKTSSTKKWIIPNIAIMGSKIYIDENVKEKTAHLLGDNTNLYESDDILKKYYYVDITEGLENSWDYEKTDVKWLSEEPPVVLRLLSSPAFNYDVVKNHHLFKINENYSSIYVSDEFVKICEENEFTGIRFKLVWDSEGLPEDFEMNPVHPDIVKWKEEMKKKHKPKINTTVGPFVSEPIAEIVQGVELATTVGQRESVTGNTAQLTVKDKTLEKVEKSVIKDDVKVASGGKKTIKKADDLKDGSCFRCMIGW